MVWYFRYRTQKNGKRVENTKRVGTVSELRTESAAWKKVDEMGMRAEINKDSAEAATFGVLPCVTSTRKHATMPSSIT